MPTSVVNYHLRSNDAAAVAMAAKNIISRQAFISPAANGWVSVCDETSESEDPVEIDRLAREFSTQLNTILFTFLVPDPQVFAYHLFQDGDLIDEYNSTPQQFGEMTQEAQDRLAGQPGMVLEYCRPGTTLAEVQAVMIRSQAGTAGGFASSASAMDRAKRLAVLLGFDRERANLKYSDLESGRANTAEPFDKVQGTRMQRPLRRPIPPRIPPR